MQAFSDNHITSSLHYTQSNELAEKYVQIVKCLINEAKEEGRFLQVFDDLPQYPSYRQLAVSMQILQSRSARYDLPISDGARQQPGIQPEVLRNINKHEVLPKHDLHVGQSVMYQDSVTKQWYQAVITSLCQKREVT